MTGRQAAGAVTDKNGTPSVPDGRAASRDGRAASAANRRDPRAAEYRRRGWWRSDTFLDDLRRHARERPLATAVVGRRSAAAPVSGGPRTDILDYAELSRLTDRFAAALLELGVRRGEFVAVQLPNRWETVPLMFACMSVGAAVCPLPPTCPEDELLHRLRLSGARVCVTVAEWDGRPVAPAVAGLRARLPGLEYVAVVGDPVPEGAVNFREHFGGEDFQSWGGRDGGRRDELALGPDEPVVMLFTSGTTGESKGVLHSQNTLHAAARGYSGALGLDGGLVSVMSTPLCHYSGFVQGVLTGVMLGGTTVFQDLPDSAALPDLVERHGGTLLYGPPSTHAAVAASQRTRPRDLGTLRHVVIGSAPLPPPLAEELHAVLGARTYALWGMSENGPVTLTRPEDPGAWAAYSNGRPVDGMEVRIEPDGRTEDGDVAGRLRVRGAGQCLGYLRNDAAYAAALVDDGWFGTGDLAREDGHGGIRILGRAADAVRRDGFLAPVSEIEATLERHPKVSEAALLELAGHADGPERADGPEQANGPGQADEPGHANRPGQANGSGHANGTVCAVLVAADGKAPPLHELHASLRESGHSRTFLPERVEAVEALPRTLTGKVRKAELRRRLTTP